MISSGRGTKVGRFSSSTFIAGGSFANVLATAFRKTTVAVQEDSEFVQLYGTPLKETWSRSEESLLRDR